MGPTRILTDNDQTAHGGAIGSIGRESSNVTQELAPGQPPCNSKVNVDTIAHRNQLESLRFDQIDARHATIKSAHVETCRWLLNKSEYLDRQDGSKTSEHNGLLWIKGKPGTGKSTIMKFAFSDARKTMTGGVVISLFFNARGDELEKSIEGMYRSVLVQLLTEVPQLQAVLDSIGPLASNKAEDHRWGIETLQHLLRQAVTNLERCSLTCFVDALDECEENQVRDMIYFFEELGQIAASSQTRFLVCFSSRLYPHITIEKSVELILHDQDGHTQDINKYIRSKLKTGRSKRAEQIKEEVQERSSGIFLWVVLVIPLLQKAFDGGRINALSDRLRTIPDGLDKLFKDVLTRDTENINDLILCLQWILYSNRPLRPEELYFAILSGNDSDEVTAWDQDEITRQDIDRFILDSSKGLGELTKTKNQTVQFIHQSVRDFLLKENGLSKLDSSLDCNPSGLGHESLKHCCHSYLTRVAVHVPTLSSWPSPDTENVEKSSRTSKEFPFLEYAVHNVLQHAEAAAGHNISQDAFVAGFPLSDWILLDNLFQRFKIRRHTPNASMLYVLAEHDHLRLAQSELRRTGDANVQGERYNFPLAVATASGSKGMVELLLRHGADLNGRIKQYHSLLFLAIHKNQEQIVELLLKHGADANDYKNDHLSSIHAASEIRNHHMVSLLLSHGARKHGRDQNFDMILHQFASTGHNEVVRMLLDADADVNFRGGRYGTALIAASCSGHDKVVQLLLDAGADVNAQIRYGEYGNVLYAACSNGHNKVVQLLLDAGADINAQSIFSGTALQAASYSGYDKIIQLLLNAGADVNAENIRNKTALQVASSRGHDKVVQILINAGADAGNDLGLREAV